MSAPTRTLRDELAEELWLARAAQLNARRRLAARDDNDNRAAAERAAEEIDAVLDCWLERDCE